MKLIKLILILLITVFNLNCFEAELKQRVNQREIKKFSNAMQDFKKIIHEERTILLSAPNKLKAIKEQIKDTDFFTEDQVKSLESEIINIKERLENAKQAIEFFRKNMHKLTDAQTAELLLLPRPFEIDSLIDEAENLQLDILRILPR